MKLSSTGVALSRIKAVGVVIAVLAVMFSVAGSNPILAQNSTVKVGVLHSLSGTMAISEVTVKNATILAIDQINASGGVLGKQIEPRSESVV